ncbi:hypothetical protein DPMN_027444 [Dreissena polymorpha]|uniref:Uncharacterized protein n=1 Tax=Dreissena polymorpha TaxID=45954 RepID=A0A9D4LUS5_DREPO|nr:hypothetical protein DPMN_027444 [Dreissena polymorpha]
MSLWVEVSFHFGTPCVKDMYNGVSCSHLIGVSSHPQSGPVQATLMQAQIGVSSHPCAGPDWSVKPPSCRPRLAFWLLIWPCIVFLKREQGDPKEASVRSVGPTYGQTMKRGPTGIHQLHENATRDVLIKYHLIYYCVKTNFKRLLLVI